MFCKIGVLQVLLKWYAKTVVGTAMARVKCSDLISVENQSYEFSSILNLNALIPQNGQTQSNNSSNCLSAFDHFVKLALKELTNI